MNAELTPEQMSGIRTRINEDIIKQCGQEKQFALILFEAIPSAVAEAVKEAPPEVDTFMTVIVSCEPSIFDSGICALAHAVMHNQELPELH